MYLEDDEVRAIYRTDDWHSMASRDLIGIATDLPNTIRIIKAAAKKEEVKLTKDDIFNIREIDQTQRYSGEGEFYIEKIPLNELV